MDFETAYAAFIEKHAKLRRGERLRRLLKGHGHGEKMVLEKIWWPAFRNFDNLHPEYEVYDFKDGHRYLDHAFISGNVMLDLEVDGYGSHQQKMSRSEFSDHLMRQNHLILDGWKVIRFSYDDLRERPRMCQQILQQFMGRWVNDKKNGEVSILSSEERDILRLALRHRGLVYPLEVATQLGISDKKARRLLHGLREKSLLEPAGVGTRRINFYRLSANVNAELLGL
ncbi:hypothetical protein SD71_06710 [Cohnella kolymensis]|uniref:DNA-binding response regulator n=1 Tax=Cohnella kolymensis TaxID=1590652 RepID=A0ABR5A8F4_9BACL|nr:hypothetical protein [Cohnella kolymensis]KIL36687.1 hypothetical protein SD71_06710 [Cohnella kolymensis]